MSHHRVTFRRDGLTSRAIVPVLAFTGIVAASMQTLVIPLVPDLPALLSTSATDAAWVVTATLLAAAVATPVAGRLGDMYGKRRVLLFSLGLLVVGSFTVALSHTLIPAIIGRLLQGLAAGTVPLGISIMRDVLPSDRLAGATAVMSASLGIGSALGLPLAALVADNADWHILFWGSGIVGVLSAVLVWVLVPNSGQRTGGRFDLLGAVGLSAGLVCLLLAISKGAHWGWTSGLVLGLWASAAAVLVAWSFYELRAREPLVDLRTTMRPQVLLTNIASALIGFSMFAVSMIVPQLVQLPEQTGYGLGGSLLMAGLVMAPQGLVMLVSSPVSARLTRAKGPKTTLMLGTAIVAAGYLLNMALMHEIWHQIVVSCVIGLGIGFAYGAMPSLIMGAVPASQTAAANSLNTLARTLGTSLASVVLGVLFAQLTTSFGAEFVPSQNAFRTAMALGAATALTALLIAAFLPRHRPAPGTNARTASATAAEVSTH
jgi:MFS family permease